MGKKSLFVQSISIVMVLLFATGCADGSIKLQPGASFSGELKPGQMGTNGSVAAGGMIIQLTDDGKGISSVEFALDSLRCTNSDGDASITSTGLSISTTFTKPIEIKDGKFILDLSGESDTILIEGIFTSPTEATATATLAASVDVTPPGQNYIESFVCDYGSMIWSGSSE